MSLFDLGIWSGKMCREPSQAENQKEQILRESSKKSVVYRRSPYLYLDRRMGHAELKEVLGKMYAKYVPQAVREYIESRGDVPPAIKKANRQQGKNSAACKIL